MTRLRDTDQLIREFLHDGLTELPDRAYDAVRSQIDHTRQRVVIGPWKEEQVSRFAMFAIAAAAVVLIAVVGVRFLPPISGIGGPPTASPSPTPTPRSLPVTGSGPVPIEAGTYRTSTPFLVPLTFAVPTGWQGNIGGPYAVFLEGSSGSAVSYTIFDTVYADPCHAQAFVDGLGPTAADLATALASLPGLTATGPIDTTIAGLPAKQLSLTAPATFADCTGTRFRLWQLPLGAANDMAPGETQRLWIVDVGHQRLVIGINEGREVNSDAKAKAQQIVDSIRISPQN
jgi:hypothetical protein